MPKILQLTDIHYDLETLRKTREKVAGKGIDLLVVTGDLAGRNISGIQVRKMYDAAEKIDRNIRPKRGNTDLETKLKFCEENKELPDELKGALEEYRKIEASFDKTAKKKYEEIKAELDEFGVPYYVIPGNWDDRKNFFEVFGDKNIHGKSAEFNGLTIAGYGGATQETSFVPETRRMPYSEQELFQFLTSEQPDIALTHMPPELTEVSARGMGSNGIVEYIHHTPPKVLLCGHAHGKNVDLDYSGTKIIKTGNLGKYGRSKGSYSEIDLNGKPKTTFYEDKPEEEKLISPKKIEKLSEKPRESSNLENYRYAHAAAQLLKAKQIGPARKILLAMTNKMREEAGLSLVEEEELQSRRAIATMAQIYEEKYEETRNNIAIGVYFSTYDELLKSALSSNAYAKMTNAVDEAKENKLEEYLKSEEQAKSQLGDETGLYSDDAKKKAKEDLIKNRAITAPIDYIEQREIRNLTTPLVEEYEKERLERTYTGEGYRTNGAYEMPELYDDEYEPLELAA